MSSAFNSAYVTNVNGVNKPVFFSEECFRSALDFKLGDGEILIATYPKCGTTWMQNLVLNILRKGEPLQKPRDFFLASPFLEQLGVQDSEEMMIRPGAFKTHLPLHKIHWSSDVKYIYVARNPKDCCLSLYNHMKQLPGYQFEKPFDEFVDMFIKGEVEYGNYFDHLIPWYNVRNEPNVFFVTFEDMLRDLKGVALKLIEFLDKKEIRFFEENSEVLDKVLYNCSFKVMKEFCNRALSSMYDHKNSKDLLNDPSIPNGRKHIISYLLTLPKKNSLSINFVRQGKSGNWKEELTDFQNERLNEMIRTKTQNTDVMTMWKEQLE